MNNGWIKLHRKLRDSEIFSDTNAYHVFSLLLLSADLNGCGKIGRHRASAELKMNPNTFYKALKRCQQKYNLVTLSSNNKVTTFSLNKWNTYQQDGNNDGNNDGNKSVSHREQLGNTIQEIRIRNKNNIYNSLRSLKESDFKEIAKSKRVSISTVKKQYDALVDYCESKGKRYKNYKAALRNFVSKAIERDKSLVVTLQPVKQPEYKTPDHEGLKRIEEMKNGIRNRIGVMPT